MEDLAYHHSVPAISRFVTAEQCDSIKTIKQDDILAIMDAIRKLNLIARESTIALEFSRRIILNRLDQAHTLVQIWTRDECEGDQLYVISTTVRRCWLRETDEIYTKPHVGSLLGVT